MSAADIGGQTCLTGASFQAQINRFFSVNFHVDPAGNDRFVARIASRYCRSLPVAQLSSSPVVISPLCHAARPAKSKYLLSLQLEGAAIIGQDGRQSRAGPGDFFLTDTARPFRIELTDPWSESLYVSVGQLRETFPEVDVCTAVAVLGESHAGRCVRAIVDEFLDLASVPNEMNGDRFAAALPHILSISFEKHLRSGTADRFAAAIRLGRDNFQRERVREFVWKNLSDPKLDAKMIAKQVGLSKGYLHRLFMREPRTLMKWIWAERLARAGRDLADGTLFGRPVNAIAYRWGFSDPAHFSRSFRSAFGVSPSQYRERARMPDAITGD
ncbi:helix-turn-helix domain-containing protein [Bradyrhizobium sp. USDA 4486]